MSELFDPSILRLILDAIGDGVVAADAAGKFLYWNAAATRLTGIGITEAGPEDWPSVYGTYRPDGVTPIPAADLPLVRAVRGEAVDDVEVLIRNPRVPEGVLVSVTGRPLRDPSGALVGGVVVFRDVANRKRIEEDLRKANVFLDSVVENIPDMIFVKDARSLRFERFNRAGELLLGIGRERLLGRNDYDLFPEDQADFFTRRDRETLRNRVLVDIPEEPIATPQGERWLHTKKIPIPDEKGEPQYLLGISSDITDRRLADAEIRRARDELEARVVERTSELVRAHDDLVREMQERRRAEEALVESERQFRQAQKLEAIGRLAGGVAHDFNNLLTVITGYAELVLGAPGLDERSRLGVDEVRKAAERAASLTRQLLAFSRRQVLQPRVVDLNAIVSDMDNMIRRLIGADIDVIMDLAPDLGRVKVDPGQMEQVVMNLVVNARDAMPEGGKLTIETANVVLDEAYARAHAGAAPGAHAMLGVSDNGHGMSAETAGRVFEPFFTTKAVDKGTGLGLATVYGIVKQSGGNIWVYSEPGRGATFEIYLPVADEASEPSEVRLASRSTRGKETILVVEDEALLRPLIVQVLQLKGYRVLEAQDGLAALRVCAENRGALDLVLTDLVMPELGGLEMMKRMGRHQRRMRVIYMSGYTETAALHQEGVPAGASFLQKPFRMEALAEKVREVLDAP